jgi:hypothetical protein
MLHSTVAMAQIPEPENPSRSKTGFYCPVCAREVDDPLTCGDCSAVICRVCGTPLESADDLAFG